MSTTLHEPVLEGPEPRAPGPPGSAGGPTGPGRRTRWLLTGGAIVASMMLGGLAFSFFGPSAPRRTAQPIAAPVASSHSGHQRLQTSTRRITRAGLASRYGIKLTLVGVTASGGLVDLRFRIIDAAKAKKLFTSASVMPAVIAEPSGTVIEAPHGGHHGRVKPATGASYFLLMGNPGGAVQRGVPVTVVFNTVRVEHIVAET